MHACLVLTAACARVPCADCRLCTRAIAQNTPGDGGQDPDTPPLPPLPPPHAAPWSAVELKPPPVRPHFRLFLLTAEITEHMEACCAVQSAVLDDDCAELSRRQRHVRAEALHMEVLLTRHFQQKYAAAFARERAFFRATPLGEGALEFVQRYLRAIGYLL